MSSNEAGDEGEEPSGQKSNVKSKPPDQAEVYKDVSDHLQETLVKQIEGWRATSTRATQVITADLVITGLLLSRSTVFGSRQFLPYLIAGLIALTFSTLYSSMVYIPSDIMYGIGSSAADKAKRDEDPVELYRAIMTSYGKCLKDNEKVKDGKTVYLSRGIWWAIAGIVFIAGSAFRIAVGNLASIWWDLLVLFVLSILVIYAKDNFEGRSHRS